VGKTNKEGLYWLQRNYNLQQQIQQKILTENFFSPLAVQPNQISVVRGRIQGFPSNPVERRAGHIYCLVSHQIPTEKSSWAHYSAIERAIVGKDAFGILKRSSDQIQGNPSDPFQRSLGRSVLDTYQPIPTEKLLGRSFQ
jgi:hypothetical protein